MSAIKNSVQTPDARESTNFYESDVILKHYLTKHVDPPSLAYIFGKLQKLGQRAAISMDRKSQEADKNGPILEKRNKWGETINKIRFHPSYRELLKIAVESEMIHIKYDDSLRDEHKGNCQKMGYAAGQLYAMSELGVYCPLCMTDGAAYLIDRYASEDVKSSLLPKLASKNIESLYTGAMYLTEKSGGSDVGRNLTEAEPMGGKIYQLRGEKWFCSNANADVIMTLARTGKIEEGTRGLSLFLVQKYLENGERNPIELIRLKEKLGVRSMATGEVVFNQTRALLLGEEGNGFKMMAEMINISRLYNAIAAVGGARRGLAEAFQFLNHRVIFGKKAVEHALIRQKLAELGALSQANFLLVWRAVRAMDNTENGNTDEKQLLRIIIPMAKWWSADRAVYIVRECMELMGGIGYIEDFIMPKLFRDVNVLPIWEGSGNVIVLDILRAMKKSDGLHMVLMEIERELEDMQGNKRKALENLFVKITKMLSQLEKLDKDEAEATAKPVFEQLIHLYQIALMHAERDDESAAWIDPALEVMRQFLNTSPEKRSPMSANRVISLLGWKY